MNIIVILNSIFVLLFIFFSFYYIKILKENIINAEISNELDFCKRDNAIFAVFIIVFAISGISRGYSKPEILRELFFVCFGLLYCLLGVLTLENLAARRMRPRIRLNNRGLIKYSIVMGIIIFVVYPLSYLGVCFLTK